MNRAATGWAVAVVGAVLCVAGPFLPWAYTSEVLDNVRVLGNPSVLQYLFGIVAVCLLAALIVGRQRGQMVAAEPRRRDALNLVGAARGAAIGALLMIAVAVVFIAVDGGGLVIVEWGGWVTLAGAVLAVVGVHQLPPGPTAQLRSRTGPRYVGILAVVGLVAAALLMGTYLLDQRDGGTFVVVGCFIAAIVLVVLRSGLGAWFGAVAAANRSVLVFAAFLAAFAFPFTQDGSDANMSIAVQILIFAATALGLNVVVGQAGLLDLGYIAFLGAGAFTAAVLSNSAFATIGWNPPFIVVVIISALVAGTLGLIVGSPTLRVSGDYLAIVTLAFGEIFRLAMINLDGTDGPNITRGSNGIPGIPDLNLLGFDFGASHEIFGITITRYGNYFFLMMLVLGLIILIFARLSNSRIGRGWVAIREDEKAAEAMGVNTFGLKILAFAGGAALAGVAGAVKAHVDVSVTPDQYIFLESAFLLAAVVLGGMGTIVGVLVGATLLELIPERLRFLDDWRLFMFGLVLVLMMRFRPEGLIPSTRRQLEFHEEDTELAEAVDPALTSGAKGKT